MSKELYYANKERKRKEKKERKEIRGMREIRRREKMIVIGKIKKV